MSTSKKESSAARTITGMDAKVKETIMVSIEGKRRSSRRKMYYGNSKNIERTAKIEAQIEEIEKGINNILMTYGILT